MNKNSLSLIQQIEALLGGPSRDKSKIQFIARYTGAIGHEKRASDEISELIYWGLPLPKHREALKALLAEKKSVQYQSKLQQHKIKSVELEHYIQAFSMTNIYDVRSVILMWLDHKSHKDLQPDNFELFFSLAEHIDNWALSDGLSMILANILEHKPELIAIYKKWNKSSNPWLRRQSLVGVYGYMRFRKKPISIQKTLPLIKNLLSDKHYYVQKGLGWCLRELDHLDSKSQRKFVKENLHKISPVAWYATSELYPLSLKKTLVTQRAKARKAKKQS